MAGEKYNTAAIIGLGLMGTSLAAAGKKNNTIERVIGYDNDAQIIAKAEKLNFIDEQFLTVNSRYNNLEAADIIIIAVPVKKIPEILADIKAKAASNSVVIDVGSCKSFVLEKAAEVLASPPRFTFVGGHPLCGSEKSGIDNFNPNMFAGEKFILTPVKELFSSNFSQKNLINFWSNIGMTVKTMKPKEHDQRMAYVSHLPQIGASSLALALEQRAEKMELLQLASSGFEDTTRLAASDAEMWSDIALTNKEFIKQAIKDLEKILEKLRYDLGNNNEEELVCFFRRAAELRKEFLARKGE